MTNILFDIGVVLFIGAFIYCQIARTIYKKAGERSKENLSLLEKCSQHVVMSEKFLKNAEQHRKAAEKAISELRYARKDK